MKWVISLLLIAGTTVAFWPKQHEPKVYDCFLFFNELELLAVRLNEMAPHVDKFVLVEAAETFRGKSKPFVFEEHQHLFEKYRDKIIHIKVTKRLDTNNPWEREKFQREQIFQAIKYCHPNDIVLLSDVDEIVRREAIPTLQSMMKEKRVHGVVCVQNMYHLFMNRYQQTWNGTVCLRASDAKRITAKKMRKLRDLKPSLLRRTKLSQMVEMRDAGWHFSSVGGADRYIKKLEAFSHAELEGRKYEMDNYMRGALKTLALVPIDHTFPHYLREHREEMERLGFVERIR